MSSTHPRRPGTRIAPRIVAGVGVAVLLGAGGYVAACAFASLPDPTITVTVPAEQMVLSDTGPAQAAVDAQELPTAIGWLDDDDVWSNDETTYPLGSITKLITMLVCMEHRPLEPGAEGETYVWTAEDAARTDAYLAVDGVAYAIPVGTALTQRDMLKFIFLPSANDYAHAYALWTFGSNEAFLEAFSEWKARHGLDSITLVEPTGMETEDRANAADLVRVARLALTNPTIAEFNGMRTAEMPWGIGTIENSNPLLGVVPGVIGTKTGTIYSNYNLIVSQQADAAGRATTRIAVTLARPSKDARAESGAAMLEAMAALPQSVAAVHEGEEVATVTSVDGRSARYVAGGSANAALLPGEQAVRTLAEDLGSITIASPSGSEVVTVHAPPPFPEPDLWWRITHPDIVFR